MKKIVGSIIVSLFTVMTLTGALYAPDKAEIGTPKNYFTNGGFERGLAGASVYFDGGTVTFTNGSSTITYTSSSNHNLKIGNVVTFRGSVPTGFTAGTTYYVVSVPTSTTFTVSLTPGGTAQQAGSVAGGTVVFHAKYPIYGGGGMGSDSYQLTTSLAKAGTTTSSCTGTGSNNVLSCTSIPPIGAVVSGSSSIPAGAIVTGNSSASAIYISAYLTSTIASATTLAFTGSPLKDSQSLLLNYTQGQNGSGYGVAFPFTIDPSDKAQMMQVSFDYTLLGTGSAFTSGSYASGAITDSDFELWIYDITNGAIIQPSGYILTCGSTVGTPCSVSAQFQTPINSTSYRALFHQVSTSPPGSVSTNTLEIDNFNVSRVTKVYGMAGSDSISYTPTCGWTTNTTCTANYHRSGRFMLVNGLATLTGAPNSANLTVSLPNGYSIDTSATGMVTSGPFTVGQGSATHSSANYNLQVISSTTTSLLLVYQSSTSGGINPVTATTPVTFASGDTVEFNFRVPIVGWSSTVQMSDQADGRAVAFFAGSANNTNIGSTPVNLSWGSITTDTHSGFNGTTGYVIPISGLYLINVQGVLQTPSSGGGASATQFWALYSNGSQIAVANSQYGTSYCGASNYCSPVPLSIVRYLTAGSVITLQVSQNAGGSVGPNAGNTAISITKVGGSAAIGTMESVNMRYTDTSGASIGTAYANYTFGTKSYDSHGAYVAGIYTCPISGKYHVSAGLGTTSVTLSTANLFNLGVAHNGILQSANFVNGNGGSGVNYSTTVSDTVNCLAGDTISIQTRAGVATTAQTTPFGSYGANWIAIDRVGN